MKPYYSESGIEIWLGDSLELLPEKIMQYSVLAQKNGDHHADTGASQSRSIRESQCGFDLVLTDPPYGVEGGHGGQTRDYRKADYAGGHFEDTPEYVRNHIVPVIRYCIERSLTVVVTPGSRCLCSYPQPDDVGCFYQPAASRISKFGFQNCQSIFYYGRYINAGKGSLHTSFVLTDAAEQNGHPCPKPYSAWSWLLKRSCLPGELVLDPFCGSGTTLVAAKNLGRRAIGIEIEEKYCAIAAKRLSQEVFNFEGNSGKEVSREGEQNGRLLGVDGLPL